MNAVESSGGHDHHHVARLLMFYDKVDDRFHRREEMSLASFGLNVCHDLFRVEPLLLLQFIRREQTGDDRLVRQPETFR